MPAPAPPEVVDAALLAVADGASHDRAALIAGVSQPTVSRWVRRLEERLQGIRTRLGFRHTRNVLRGLDRMTVARIDDAATKDSRTGAQSFDAVMRYALPRGPESLTINGDVDASVNVSADVRVVVAQGLDAAELRRRAEEHRAKLGF